MTAWTRLAFLCLLAAASVALLPWRPALADGPEAAARDLELQLMCPICPGQTIAQADNEISRQMKAIIRKKLADGETREQVLAFFVERYGEAVLAAPPRQGFNLAVWLAPFAVLAAGAAIVFIAVRRAVRPRAPASDAETPPADMPESEARRYRERVAREMAQRQAKT
ncbi:MAG: cytochrome c-type biogenesis protein CcmH [Dehalococcoidia bacterium]|nr:cytochrome c-type biogenesis protein CcmH [Dehalococcoidia bacterium]